MIKRSYSQIGSLLWALLIVVLFIIGPGQRSGVHLFPLPGQSGKSIFAQIITINFPLLLFDLLKAFSGATIFLFSAVGWGKIFIKFIDKSSATTNESGNTFITAFVLGQSLLSFLFLFLLVTLHDFTHLSSFLVIFTGLVLLFFPFHHPFNYILAGLKSFLPIPSERKVLLPVLLSLILLGAALLYSSSRLSYDAASQYFAQAKIIAQTGGFRLLSFKDAFAGSALYLTSLQSAIIQLFGDQAARIYSWMSGLAILSFCMLLGKSAGISRRAQALFLPLAMSTTAIVDLLCDGKIDLATTATALACVYWFSRSLHEPSRRSLFVAGFLGGFAVVVRPYNAVLLGVFCLLVFLFHLRSVNQPAVFFHAFKNAVLGLLPPVLFWGASYLIINGVFLGDMLAPLKELGLVGSNDWPMYTGGWHKGVFIIIYPLAVTLLGAFDTLGLISPIFVGFLPFFFVKEVRALLNFSRELIFFSVSAVVTLYLWLGFFGSINILEVRYVLFLWVLLFLPLAELLDHLLDSSFFIKAGTHAILVTLLVFMTVRTIIVSLGTYSPISKNGVPQCRDLPMCTFFEPVNQQGAPGDRVLVLSAYRYYLRPDLFACSSGKDDYLALEQTALQNPIKFWQEVQRQGYRYVVYDSFFSQYILRFQGLSGVFTSLPPTVRVTYNRTFQDYDLRTITESIYQVGQPLQGSPEMHCTLINNKWVVQSQ